MQPLEKKDGIWWLLVPRGRLLPHLCVYRCNIGSHSSKLKRCQMCLQEKNLVHLTLNHARLPGSNGQSLLPVISSCRGKRHETVNQTNNLERFSAHQGPGSWMFWKDYQSYPSDHPRRSSLSKNSACWCAHTIAYAIMRSMWWVKDLCTNAGLWSYWDWGNMVRWHPWQCCNGGIQPL